MVINTYDNYEEMSRKAADFILAEIRRKPDLLIAIATGGTPTRTYEILAGEYEADPAQFDKVRIVKLDEWGGIPLDSLSTCETYIRKYIIKPLGISPERYMTFNSDPKSPKREVGKIVKMMKLAGRIDLCILGLGVNGHIAFNEPAASLKAGPHVAKLSKESRNHTMAVNDKDNIKYGLTLGMGNILQSFKIMLLVNGKGKSEIFEKLKKEKVSTRLPASFLWLHSDANCFCDKESNP